MVTTDCYILEHKGVRESVNTKGKAETLAESDIAESTGRADGRPPFVWGLKAARAQR
jgi:hypothetical protein